MSIKELETKETILKAFLRIWGVRIRRSLDQGSKNFLAAIIIYILRSPKGVIGIAIVAGLLGVAVFAPYLAPHDPYLQQLPLTLATPSWEYPFGNDQFGRDILSRLVVGSRLSVGVGLIPPFLGGLLGVPLGLLAGYRTNLFSVLTTRAADVILAFPGLLIVITLASVMGPGLVTVGTGITIFLIPGYIRIVFGEVLSLREREFVLSAHCVGANNARIVMQHILPNITTPIIVHATLNIATTVLAASALSYLGLGAQPPAPEWGALVSDGQRYLRSAPHLVIFSGLAIMALVLGFSLLGDALQDAVDPTRRRIR